MSEYLVRTPDVWTQESILAPVRWDNRDGKLVLQQAWQILTIKDGYVEKSEEDWRDVPTVLTPEASILTRRKPI